MKQLAMWVVVLAMVVLGAACGATSTGGGGGGDECSVNADCATHCNFTGAWAAGASGSTTNGGFCAGGSCFCCYAQFDIDPDTGDESNGRCYGCDEVGCNADVNYACYATDDVCLYSY